MGGVNLPRRAFLVGSGAALFAQSQQDRWQFLGKDKNISVYAERAWYGTRGYGHFFIHVRIFNTTDRALSVDLRNRFEMPYPNQWTVSMVPLRGMIDENRARRVELDVERTERLLAGFRDRQLTEIAGQKSLEYYSMFNAEAPKADDIDKARYLIVSMAGQLFYTDGTAPAALYLQLQHTETDLVIALPPEYDHIPDDARLFFN